MTDIDRAVEQAAAAVMPFESWEQLRGESGLAYAAFRVFRDLGLARTIRKAVEGQFRCAELPTEFPPAAKTPHENLDAAIAKKYRVWRNWSAAHRWTERAADYDRYTEKLKAAERRKTIEAQGEQHRAVTGKMLVLVEKKLDTMNPAELTQGAVTEWVQTAIKAEREAAGLVASGGDNEPKQGELVFAPEFKGL